MTYKDVIDLYLRLLNRLSKELGRYDKDVPFVTPQDISLLLSNWSKYQEFHEKVVRQPAFDTDSSRALLELFYESLTPVKTILDRLKSISDYNKLDRELVDLLLRTFGFDYLYFPVDVKRQLLIKLVSLYKKKGTLDALKEVLKTISTLNVSVSEVYFEKVRGEPYFTYQVDLSVPGVNYKTKFYVDPDKYIQNDPHWFITKDELRDWPITKAVTPYINLSGVVNLQTNLKATILLRTFAAKDYQVYLQCKQSGDMSEYEKTKVINLDMLPHNINFLELYELIRYIYLKRTKKTQEVSPLPDDVPTYSYRPPDTEYDIIVDELHRQFQTRHTETGQASSVTRVTEYEPHIKQLFLSRLPDQIETQKLILDNLTRAGCISIGSNVVVVGGIDTTTGDYNRKVYIIDIHSLHTYVIETGIEVVDPIVIASKSKSEIQVGGGYTLEGKSNYRCWVVSLVDYTWYRTTDLPQDMWMENPLVVSSESSCYVISRSYNDKYPGAIYEWNLQSNYKRLVALIDPNDYDITTVNGCILDSGEIYLTVVSKLSGRTRILYLNPNPTRDIFADITCAIVHNTKPLSMRVRLSKELEKNNVVVIADRSHILLVTQSEDGTIDYWVVQVTVTEGPLKSKIYPRRFSGVLLPSRLCYLCPKCDIDLCCGDPIAKILALRNWDEVKVDLVGYDYWNGFLFVKVYDNFKKGLHPYWPLVQQIRSIPYQSKSATVEAFLPNIDTQYDSRLKKRLTYDKVVNLDNLSNYVKEPIDINSLYSKESTYDDLLTDKTKNRLRYDLESFKVSFPRFYFLDFDKHLRIMGTYSNVDEFAFRDLYRLKSSLSNDHFCYVLHDDSEKYDVSCELELVCYSSLPDYVESIIPPDKKTDFDKVYRVLKSSEWIVIDYATTLYNMLSKYFVGYPGVSLHTTHNKQLACFCYEDHIEIVLLWKYTYLDKLIPKEFTFTYDDSNTCRGKKSQLLKDRKQKLTGPEALPNFESFDELSQFLAEVTPGNKLEIDSAFQTHLDKIQYELLYFVSNLYPGADLSTLIPGSFSLSSLYPIVNMFKPIYTRYIHPSIITTCSDPTSDWLALTDSFELQFIHTFNSYVDLFDLFRLQLLGKTFDNLEFSDSQLYVATEPALDTFSLEDFVNEIANRKLFDYMHLHESLYWIFVITLHEKCRNWARYDSTFDYDSPLSELCLLSDAVASSVNTSVYDQYAFLDSHSLSTQKPIVSNLSVDISQYNNVRKTTFDSISMSDQADLKTAYFMYDNNQTYDKTVWS